MRSHDKAEKLAHAAAGAAQPSGSGRRAGGDDRDLDEEFGPREAADDHQRRRRRRIADHPVNQIDTLLP